MDNETDRQFAKLFPGGFSHRDEANALVAFAFRNGPIEDLHAGRQSDLLADPELSRITDDEMKAIMINASETLAKLLSLGDNDPAAYRQRLKQICLNYCVRWNR